MLSRYIISTLTDKIAPFISNLDPAKIKISLYNGELCLNDLYVKPEALESLLPGGMPLEILYGRIGTLEVKLQLKKCIVVISDVTILIIPGRRNDLKEKEKIIKKLMKKQRKVDNRWSMMGEVSKRILSGLSITVKNVHIRYEDLGRRRLRGVVRPPFAIGLTLVQFCIQTTDLGPEGLDESDNENDSDILEEKDIMERGQASHLSEHKLMAVYQLAVYWDSGTDLMCMKWKEWKEEEQRRQREMEMQQIFNEQKKSGRRRRSKRDKKSPSVDDLSLNDLDISGIREKKTKKAHVRSNSDTHIGVCDENSSAITEDESYLLDDMSLGTTKSSPPSTFPLPLPPKSLSPEDDAFFTQLFSRLDPPPTSVPLHDNLHNYILTPTSPSLHFTLINIDPNFETEKAIIIPPSKVKVNIPSCHLSIARETLEDVAFLRKMAKSGRLSESTLVYLASQRPTKSPKQNPRGWWHYAILATIATTQKRRKHTWRSVFQLLQKRKLYMNLYKEAIEDSQMDKVIELETDLSPEEIASFRLSTENDLGRTKGWFSQNDNLWTEIEGLRSSTKVDPRCRKWEMSLICSSLTLQANDTKTFRRKFFLDPIVRLTCQSHQKIILKENGCWILDAVLGNFEVVDLMNKGKVTRFPKLLSRKTDLEPEEVMIGHSKVPHSASIHIHRTLYQPDQSGERKPSDLVCTIRLLPLEAVYSTDAVEALTRLFSAAKTKEFADDYFRISSALQQWQAKQQAKLMHALAKERKMIINIDVAAPLLMIPEDFNAPSCPMLVIDLGRLMFYNTPLQQGTRSFQLAISNIQVLCFSSTNSQTPLVEPFNLIFSVTTNFAADEDDTNEINVKATLPRLVFNLTSSAVRLVTRLRMSWSRTKRRSAVHVTRRYVPLHADIDLNKKKQATYFLFQFSAPLITLRLENDVDGRNGPNDVTALACLTIEGISGTYTKDDSQTFFFARLHSLHAIDLYQQAGEMFSPLLSSICLSDDEKKEELADLVKVEYQRGKQEGSQLSITFHELYVEWNPETIAAIQKAMRIPFGEAEAKGSIWVEKKPRDIVMVTGISSISEEWDQIDNSTLDSPPPFDAPAYYNMPLLHAPSPDSSVVSLPPPPAPPPTQSSEPFKISFLLSKLRVNFNKESRHRRLITAQMDGTSVQYLMKAEGGSKINADVGNLTFDDKSTEGGSLYGQILGLKTDPGPTIDSIVRMEYENFPRGCEDKRGAIIDEGSVEGCDSSLRLHFSPMKFVYLQQLWMEIVDYLFEGILGYAVLGKVRPSALSIVDRIVSSDEDDIQGPNENIVNTNLLPGFDGTNYSFLKFEISLEAPVLILPVTYRSPHHIRLVLNHLSVSNHFTGHVENTPLRWQWYNNCEVVADDVQIISWCGKSLSLDAGIVMKVMVTWPSGPMAPLVVPKWRVNGVFGDVRLSLRRIDYALLTNFIYYNVLETSRHLFEWEEYKRMEECLLVPFGYDKKDTPPTTYTISLTIGTILLQLSESGQGVADIQCSDLCWSMTKLKNQISHQKVTCGSINLIQTSGKKEWGGFEELLLPLRECNVTDEEINEWERQDSEIKDATGQYQAFVEEATTTIEKEEEQSPPTLIYKSVSSPSGDNVKTLEINDACIYLVYPAWQFVKNFFVSLPNPEIFSTKEVKSYVQIGDRWYQIDNFSSEGDFITDTADIAFQQKDTVISAANTSQTPISTSNDASKQFRLILNCPRIVVVADSDEDCGIGCKGVTLKLNHLDYLYKNLPNGGSDMAVFLHDLEVFTGHAKNPLRHNTDHSLLHPLCIGGTYRVNEKEKNIAIISEVFRARSAYSDMSLAIDVAKKVITDVKTAQELNMEEEQSSTSSDDKIKENQTENHDTYSFIKTSTTVRCDGFSLLIIDDSLRQFAEARDLIEISLGGLQYDFKKEIDSGGDYLKIKGQRDKSRVISSTNLRLNCVNIIDYLQPIGSPYRIAATSIGDSDEGNLHNNASQIGKGKNKKMTWENYCMKEDSNWGYIVSDFMLRLLEEGCPSNIETNCPTINKNSSFSNYPDLIEVSHREDSGVHDNFDFRFRRLTFQYNPATIIALQRFIGRLRKNAKSKFHGSDRKMKPCHSVNVESLQDNISEVLTEDIDQSNYSPSISEETLKKSLRASFKVERITICLNKEHQNRRLLHATINDTTVAFSRDNRGQLDISGAVGDIYAWDPSSCSDIADGNKAVLSVVRNGASQPSTKLLTFQFQTFCDGGKPSSNWVATRAGLVDDFLNVQIGTIRFVYLRDRTAELVDYLSNGLPGKGMGATKRAAKGFLRSRIKTRSALQVAVDAPIIYVPRHRAAHVGITLRLGDVIIKSWFEEGFKNDATMTLLDESVDLDETHLFVENFDVSREESPQEESSMLHAQKDWWRCLSLSILNMGRGTALSNPIDFRLILRKPSWYSDTVIVRGRLSQIETVLNYQDWYLFRAILTDNVAKPVDMSRWDNVEKAAAEGRSEDDASMRENASVSTKDDDTFEDTHSIDVAYADGARIIRYGNRNNRDNSVTLEEQHPSLDFNLKLDGLCLTLHRNEHPSDDAAMSYDLCRLRVERVMIGLSSQSNGSRRVNIKLYKMDLVDLGDRGRSLRGGILSTQKPCAFSVLAEGYGPVEDDGPKPQLVITYETSLYRSPVASIALNYLNMNALFRPVAEIVSFMKCSWPLQNIDDTSLPDEIKQVESNNLENQVTKHQRWASYGNNDTTMSASPSHESNTMNESKNESNTSESSGFVIKLVAHYPRVFLLSDESDPFTRALVLRGLAVVNASIQKELVEMTVNDAHTEYSKSPSVCADNIRTTFSLSANLDSMESYINPNVDSVLGPNRSLGEGNDNFRELGIALMEPVTAVFDISQVQRELHPTERTISLSMEPVSTMISFEDLDLIDAVLRRWNIERRKVVKERKEIAKEDEVPLSKTLRSQTQSAETLDIPSPSQVSFFDAPILIDHNHSLTISDCATASSAEYDVFFNAVKLGLVLRKSGADFIIEDVQIPEYAQQIQNGDTLVAIESKRVHGMPLRTVTHLLSITPRPTKLTFQPTATFPKSTSNISLNMTQSSSVDGLLNRSSMKSLFSELSSQSYHDSEVAEPVDPSISNTTKDEIYTISFAISEPNGLVLERGVTGDITVVTGLDHCQFTSSIVKGSGRELSTCHLNGSGDAADIMITNEISASTDDPGSVGQGSLELELLSKDHKVTRLPRPGAVILAINQTATTALGHNQTIDLLNKFTGACIIDNEKTDTTSNPASRATKLCYSITFLEAKSSDWASVDSIDVSISGIKLTIIDDINGRDMPLLRGDLSDIDIRLKRGFNLETKSIKVPLPSILKWPPCAQKNLPTSHVEDLLGNGSHACFPRSDLSELIIKLNAKARIGLEYYNARVALWEPLLEPCLLQFQLEWQKGNSSKDNARPGNLAVTVTDGCAISSEKHSEEESRSMMMYGNDGSGIYINLTDAAMEMLIKTACEWDEWKKSRVGSMEVETAAAAVAANLDDVRDMASKVIKKSSSKKSLEDFSRRTNDSSKSSKKHLEENKKKIMNGRLAAQKAAAAALEFARKRGAQKKGDIAKPFVLRNRTGVSIAFVPTIRNDGWQFQSQMKFKKPSNNKYGLEGDVREVTNGDESRFNMDVIIDEENTSKSSKRVNRTYDGQFPSLCVALDPSLGAINWLENLPLVKVGKTTRELRVTDEKTGDSSSITVVWTVELVNNRRVLTLSGAISVASIACGMPIEVGAREQTLDEPKDSEMVVIGISKPDMPCFLPLWLGLKKDVSIHVRPAENSKVYNWSEEGILECTQADLHLEPSKEDAKKINTKEANENDEGSPYVTSSERKWRPIRHDKRLCNGASFGKVHCLPLDYALLPVWLSYNCSVSRNESIPSATVDEKMSKKPKQGKNENKQENITKRSPTDHDDWLCVSIGSTLTLRNLLPVDVEWEITNAPPYLLTLDGDITLLDGSSLRREQHIRDGICPLSTEAKIDGIYSKSTDNTFDTKEDTNYFLLRSGYGLEAFSCDTSSMTIHARFRCGNEDSGGDEWTDWALLRLPEENKNVKVRNGVTSGSVPGPGPGLNVTSSKVNPIPSSDPTSALHIHGHQITVQSRSLMPGSTISIKIFPKSSSHFIGIDVILHAELWIRNLTNLPIVFGAPAVEMREGGSLPELDATVAAEAAIMEIASVLEFGDKGLGLLNVDNEDSMLLGDVEILPRQQSNEVYEEVFEYIEVQSSVVKRRWWATERHDCIRPPPHETIVSGWKWKSGWKVDCSGQTSELDEGWESCRSLVGIGVSSFGKSRIFDPLHNFRRRRWFRCRIRNTPTSSVVFHQPIITPKRSFANESSTGIHDNKGKRPALSLLDVSPTNRDGSIKLCLKCGDGRWSRPAIIPQSGNGHGLFRISASRWPLIRDKFWYKSETTEPSGLGLGLGSCIGQSFGENVGLLDNDRYHIVNELAQTQTKRLTHASHDENLQVRYSTACLSPTTYELLYNISVLSGPWGEFSRILVISPRYLVRNDSKKYDMEIKQVNASDDTARQVKIGEVVPFHWADTRLPELVCVRPNLNGKNKSMHRWSGGFDICCLGMLPLRIRQKSKREEPLNDGIQSVSSLEPGFTNSGDRDCQDIRTIRAHVEITKGTGGTGITLSLREESPLGEGSLFRIENRTPFPLWIAQDGVLANPVYSRQDVLGDLACPNSIDECIGVSSNTNVELTGDLVKSMENVAFGLDVPFRQGKYAGRRAASLKELLLLRAALAPLSSRGGIESTKVIGLTKIGNSMRLSPSKLTTLLGDELVTQLLSVRVMGIVCADGPTRVLRFCLTEKEVTTKDTMSNHLRLSALGLENSLQTSSFLQPSQSPSRRTHHSDMGLRTATLNAALKTNALMCSGSLLTEEQARIEAFQGKDQWWLRRSFTSLHNFNRRDVDDLIPTPTTDDKNNDCDYIFTFSGIFRGFVLSVVDAVPSEIAVASLRSVEAVAKWNLKRTNDAIAAISVGWLQVDNHCPSAPFPVAVSVDEWKDVNQEQNTHPAVHAIELRPVLTVGLTFAPKHNSGISCLKAVTIAPRDLSVSVDLAFIVRMQQFLLGVQEHLDHRIDFQSNKNNAIVNVECQEKWKFPDIDTIFKEQEAAAATVLGDQNFYFANLTILPCNVSLSVAPARALTHAQAILEGNEAAAVHAAVRKGDLLIGDGAGLLRVKTGMQNRTALAVVRGVFRSILVDALLRCDEAALNFPGVALRHHISSRPQLATYLTAHYLSALRSNVPALLGSLAAFGNPIGLMRGLGDGMSDFVSEPIKGLKKSMEELNPSLFMDGVARGTGSLARHTVGGFADSASMLTETLSKNMAVLTLDRQYALRRDRRHSQRAAEGTKTTFVDGIGSGGAKLLRGVLDGITGVVRAPMRGAEKNGVEGFAKGVGKGILGLIVKPVIGLTDAATDVMIGVKGSVEGDDPRSHRLIQRHQLRPRRALYGQERALRVYSFADATAARLMMRTRLAGEAYLSHCDLDDRVALLSVKHLLIFGIDGSERLMLKFKEMKDFEVKEVATIKDVSWGVLIFLSTPRKNGEEVEVVVCSEKVMALNLSAQLKRGVNLVTTTDDAN